MSLKWSRLIYQGDRKFRYEACRGRENRATRSGSVSFWRRFESGGLRHLLLLIFDREREFGREFRGFVEIVFAR